MNSPDFPSSRGVPAELFWTVREPSEHNFNMPWWLWVASGIVLVVIEARATREFTLLCIGSSAIAVGLMTALGIYSLPVQFISFALLSGATLFWAVTGFDKLHHTESYLRTSSATSLVKSRSHLAT